MTIYIIHKCGYDYGLRNKEAIAWFHSQKDAEEWITKYNLSETGYWRFEIDSIECGNHVRGDEYR